MFHHLAARASRVAHPLIRLASTQINGNGKTALILGGFAFTERAMSKHAALYDSHGFDTVPILSSVKDLTTPSTAARRGYELAEKVVALDQHVVCHFISGSFWTGLYMLDSLDQVGGHGWRDKNVKAICFDSCPPKSDTSAFGGFVAFRFKNPKLKQMTAPLFEPYRAICGINTTWEAENHAKMFGHSSVIPRGAHQLHIRGKNDPVLDSEYLQMFLNDCRANCIDGVSIKEATFMKSKHSMAVVEHPNDYKSLHIAELLSKVEEWKLAEAELAVEENGDFELSS